MLPIHDANHQITWFIICFCRNFQQHRVVPERLSLDEIDAMLGAIALILAYNAVRILQWGLNQLRDAYFARCYHQPCDAWTSNWDAVGQAQDVELLYAMGRGIADSEGWPYWREGSEFKATRERSETERK